jgi:hypothetical protein
MQTIAARSKESAESIPRGAGADGNAQLKRNIVQTEGFEKWKMEGISLPSKVVVKGFLN